MDKEVGTTEWFRQEALKRFKPDIKVKGQWDFTDSSLIWHPAALEVYRQLQEGDTAYSKVVTDEETLLIQKIAPKIVSMLPERFLYIDLGPGTEHKEKYFFDVIKTSEKEMTYVPVDINKGMLDSASEYAKTQGFGVKPLHLTFEDVVDALKNENAFKFVSIGATFINYYPQEGVKLLKDIATKNGAIFITVQLRDRINSETLKKTYGEGGNIVLMKMKLSLLGIDPDKDIKNLQVTDGVEIYFDIVNVPEILRNKGVKPGDKIKTGLSFRYTLKELENIFSGFKVTYFDENYSFIGIFLESAA